jgi:hypothetical protein
VVENILHSQFPSQFRSWQGIEIRPSISFDQGPQSVWRNHFNLVAPLVKMPGNLKPPGRSEPDDQASVILWLQSLRGMKTEFSGTLGGIAVTIYARLDD